MFYKKSNPLTFFLLYDICIITMIKGENVFSIKRFGKIGGCRQNDVGGCQSIKEV